VAFIRIGNTDFVGFDYDTYIAGIFDRMVDSRSAVLVYADANQKLGTQLGDANGNKVSFKPQAILDESLKQQKKIAELEATVERQRKGMEALTAQLKEQAAQIQKVSAQVEATEVLPKIVLNNP
jgi:septal ring factor EnvC (AmiA/AmiB activator)